MIFATEKAMKESGDKLTEEDKNTLKEACEQAKKDLETADTAEKAREIIEELSKKNTPIFTKLYQAAQAEAQANAANGQQDNNNGGNNGDDIIIDNDDNNGNN